MSTTKKRPDADDSHRQIIARPDDEALFEFLAGLFYLSPSGEPGKVKDEADHFPERITLRTVFNVGAREDVGPVLHQEEWKASAAPLLRTEQIVELSNRLLQKAKHDCSCAGRKMLYTVTAHSNRKGAEPYARHLISLNPGGRELAVVPEEDDATTTKGLLRELYRDRRFQQEHTLRMFESYQSAMDGVIGRYEARLAASEQANATLLQTHMQLVQLKEELADRKLARELKADRERFMQEKIQKGINLVETVAVPLIMKKITGHLPQPAPIGGGGDTNVVAAWLRSLNEVQEHALFGVWSAGHQVKRGLLSAEQARALAAIADGQASGDAIGAFVSTLDPQQLAGAQAILTQEQTAALLAIFEVGRQANGAAS
jgi:hypothetical protein